MAKAYITTPSGAKITIEGTANEVAEMVRHFEPEPLRNRVVAKPKRQITQRNSGAKIGPVNLLAELIDGGFFRKPKELSAIKIALEEQGHFYPVTTLSPAVLRLVRKRELRRVKDKKRWLYVGG